MSERFFGHGLLPITFYQPDFSALKGASARVVVGEGPPPRASSPSALLPRWLNASARR